MSLNNTNDLFCFQELPSDILSEIVFYCSSQTRKQFSLTNSKIKSLIDQLCEVLSFKLDIYKKINDENVFKNILVRFPNIKKINFSVKGLCKVKKNFDASIKGKKNLLVPLAPILESSYPKNLCSLDLVDVSRNTSNSFCLNPNLLYSLANSQILNLKIELNGSSRINKQKVFSVLLKKCKNLTSFHLNAINLNLEIGIPLSLCENLQCVCLKVRGLGKKTIDHLKLCTKLKKIHLDCCRTKRSLKNLDSFLLSAHQLDLTVLDLGSIECLQSNQALNMATKKLQNLKFFACTGHRFSSQVNHEGIIQLFKNCSNLTTLIYNFGNINDEGVEKILQYAQKLECLSMTSSYRISGQGIQAIAKYCQSLKALKLFGIKMLNALALNALAENCKNLQSIEILCCSGMTIKEMDNFVSSSKSLKFLTIINCKNISKVDIQQLFQKHSSIK